MRTVTRPYDMFNSPVTTKRKSAKTTKWVKKALYAIKLRRVRSMLAAAMEFNMPKDRLYQRKSRSEACTDQQLLTKRE
jgi:outer membrane protein assembly factor BamD (BamD/ComL family)